MRASSKSRVRRRNLLAAVGAGLLVDRGGARRRPIRGRIVGNAYTVGHRLRNPIPTGLREKPRRADVVVVGSGVSGLSAAWRLGAAGIDCTVVELAPFAGGTSAWGDDGVVPHPWGGHYLPAPNPECRATLRMLQQFGVLTGFDAAGRPLFDPEMLCHAPEERLYYGGRWHRGLVPWTALSRDDREQFDRFGTYVERFTRARGRDGRYVFQLPCELSSRDPDYLAFDRLSMATWLRREGFTSPFLHWYVDYATRDDFGGHCHEVSAWAGWHYYTARKLRTEQLGGSRFLVWPEGNGWLIKRLIQKLASPPLHDALVTMVRPTRRGVTVDYFDTARRRHRRLEARAAIVATPAFVARRIVAPAISYAHANSLRHRPTAPWLVANLHLQRPIDANLPWDSVIFDAAGLGYVDAGHQRSALCRQSVWTYYWTYGGADINAARQRLLDSSWEQLASEVLLDLADPHPELLEQTERLDIMRWGHAMPRPYPGFLGNEPFSTACALDRRIAWAHVDQTGFALFEEATQRGVRAAEVIADALGAKRGESWL